MSAAVCFKRFVTGETEADDATVLHRIGGMFSLSSSLEMFSLSSPLGKKDIIDKVGLRLLFV